MPFLSARGADLFYTDAGDGQQTLLFVHGTACDTHDWDGQLAHFARRHRVIAVDLRGHGRSSAPEGGYDAKDLAEDLAQVVQALDCGPVIAFGHSLGGILVSLLAVEHPDLVQALVCVDPGYLVPDDRLEMVEGAFASVRDNPRSAMTAMFESLDSPATPAEHRQEHIRRIEDLPGHVIIETMHNYIWAMRSASEPFLRRRTCPVLTIHSDVDRIDLERQLLVDPRSRAITWSPAGHWLHQERPDDFHELVDDWLRDLEEASPSARR